MENKKNKIENYYCHRCHIYQIPEISLNKTTITKLIGKNVRSNQMYYLVDVQKKGKYVTYFLEPFEFLETVPDKCALADSYS